MHSGCASVAQLSMAWCALVLGEPFPFIFEYFGLIPLGIRQSEYNEYGSVVGAIFLEVVLVCLRYLRSYFSRRCPWEVAVFIPASVLHSPALSAPGGVGGPLLRLRQFLPSYLSVTFAFICVGWRCGTDLGTFSCGCLRQCCQGCGFFPPHQRFSR